MLEHPEHVLRRLFEHSRLEVHYDHRTRIASYRCLLTTETIGQLRTLAKRHLLPFGEIRADVPARLIHGQLVVSGQAVLATDSARLTRDPDLASPAATFEIESLSRHRCMPWAG